MSTLEEKNRERRLSITEVNAIAQASCSRWEKSRYKRHRRRKKYQKIAMRECASPAHQQEVAKYRAGDYERNTYPWPYSSQYFADWDESDKDGDYSLISDPSGFVVKHATSYVAYKIFELTGKWPQRIVKRRYDAWDWVDFLDQAGYNNVVFDLTPGHHYVGVRRREGRARIQYQQGLVVWVEKIPEDGGPVRVSTYIKKRHENLFAMKSDYIWVEIPTPKSWLR